MKIDLQIPAGLIADTQRFLGVRSPINMLRLMGEAVKEKTREHLAGLAESRHTTANRLGATPSGHLAQAAQAVESAPLSVTSEEASFSIQHIGMIRALRDVTLVPRTAKNLAIPIHAIAYNRRPSQIWDEMNLFAAKGKIFMPQGKGQPPLALYILKRSVTQKQDRTLLPSISEWKSAAVAAAEEAIRSA